MLLRFGRRNDRRVGVALLDLEMFADMASAAGRRKSGNRGVRLIGAERVMRGRLVSLAVTAWAARFFARTARPRMVELIEACFELCELFEPRRAMQFLAAESAAAVRRVAVRAGEQAVKRVATICWLRFSPEPIVMSLRLLDFRNSCGRAALGRAGLGLRPRPIRRKFRASPYAGSRRR